MIKKIHKSIKESILTKTLSAVKKNPKIFLWMFLLDLGLIGIFLLINTLFNLIAPSDGSFISQARADTLIMIGVVMLFIVYILLMVIVYSFFNLIVLGNIKSLSKDHKHDFSMFKRMFLLNLFMFTLFFVLFMIFNTLAGLLENASMWALTVFFVVLAIVIVGSYAFYNFAHTSFINGDEFSVNLKKAFKGVFTRSYLGLFIFSVAVIGVYFLLYLLAGFLFRDFIITHYSTYMNVVTVITLIVVYIVFSFNRIYFFFIYEKMHGTGGGRAVSAADSKAAKPAKKSKKK